MLCTAQWLQAVNHAYFNLLIANLEDGTAGQ